MVNFFKKAEKVINGITILGAIIGGFFTAIMTAIVAYAVVVRYILNRPIGWSEEISIYLMIWAIFLATAYTLKEDAHIGVDIVINRVSEKTRSIFHLFHYSIGIIFLSFLFYKGIEMVDLSYKFNNRSIATGFPLFIPQLAVPVGSALLILQLLVKLLKVSLKLKEDR